MKRLALSVALMAAAVGLAPVGQADMNLGDYEIQWSRPWDFHTWVLQITQCVPASGAGALPGCAKVSANPRPIARALQWNTVAHLEIGRYTFTVDVPEGSAVWRLLRPVRSHPRHLLVG